MVRNSRRRLLEESSARELGFDTSTLTAAVWERSSLESDSMMIGRQPGLDDSTIELLAQLTGEEAQMSQYFQGAYFVAIGMALIPNPFPGDEAVFIGKGMMHFLTGAAMFLAHEQIDKQVSKRTPFQDTTFGVKEFPYY